MHKKNRESREARGSSLILHPSSFARWVVAACLATFSPFAATQAYPSKPVRVLVTGVGSGGDFAARLIAQGVSPSLGQQVIVDNRGSGNLPAEITSKSPPDGYTLCLSAAPLWITPFLRKTHYDPIRDFTPVTLVVTSPNILVVHPSLPARSVKELLALLRARPGQLNYATSGVGGSGFLAAELFKSMARADMVRVNYKSGGLAITELMSGEVQLFFANPGAAAPHMKSGRLRALAVTSAQPSPLLPGLPTVATGGLPGYELVSVQGLFAPAKTPDGVVARLNQEIVAFLRRPDVKDKFFAAGMEPLGSPPEALAATVKAEMTRLGKVIQAAGIALEP
jgi:tripartite-type tricarboxylate transporter receptor subunit TctC